MTKEYKKYSNKDKDFLFLEEFNKKKKTPIFLKEFLASILGFTETKNLYKCRDIFFKIMFKLGI